MSGEADRLARLIEQTPGLPKSSDEVYAQDAHYFPGTWKEKWPGGVPLPAGLSAVEDGSRRSKVVSRRDVFEAMRNVTNEESALDAYVVMCGWGAGPLGQPGYRCRRPLAEPGIAEKLLRTHRAIRDGANPVEVYKSLSEGSDRIKYFGPAFFTKWLYFSGYDMTPSDGDHARPLILDARVAASLGWQSWGWTGDQYGVYRKLAGEIAEKLGGVDTHVVEHALFVMRGEAIEVDDEPDMSSIVLSGVTKELREALNKKAASEGLTVEEYVVELATVAVNQ